MESQTGEAGRSQRVVFETDRHLVSGTATLPPEGFQSRFSDWINRSEVAFIPLVDVEIRPHDGGDARRLPFLVLAKSQIHFAHPAEAE